MLPPNVGAVGWYEMTYCSVLDVFFPEDDTYFFDNVGFLLRKRVPPNKNREVVLYDHFAGDNYSLKFIIQSRKKNMFF